MSYTSPSEEYEFQKTYSEVKKCPICGSKNIQKTRGKDHFGDVAIHAKCNSYQHESTLQVGLGHGWDG